MCHTFQTFHSTSDLDTVVPGRSAGEPFIRSEVVTEVLVAPRGSRPSWKSLRFGLDVRGGFAGLVLTARVDQLQTVERWCMMGTQRCVVPTYGYRSKFGGDWVKVSGSWAFGFHEYDNGFVLVIDHVRGLSVPLTADWSVADAWITAEQWDTVPMLRQVAKHARSQADINIAAV